MRFCRVLLVSAPSCATTTSPKLADRHRFEICLRSVPAPRSHRSSVRRKRPPNGGPHAPLHCRSFPLCRRSPRRPCRLRLRRDRPVRHLGWQLNDCARLATGKVVCWGSDGSSSHAEPVEVPGLDDAIQVSAGYSRYCALRQGGRVVCWRFSAGANRRDLSRPRGLGESVTTPRSSPGEV
ncbi:hypothetical protein [Sorangium cellulosum]